MCLELVWIEGRKAFQARRGTGVKIDTLYLGTQMKSRDTCLRKIRTRRGLINTSVAKVESGIPERFMCSSCS